MKTLGRRVDREPLDQAVAFPADVFLEEDGAEFGERLRRRVVERPDHGFAFGDIQARRSARPNWGPPSGAPAPARQAIAETVVVTR